MSMSRSTARTRIHPRGRSSRAACASGRMSGARWTPSMILAVFGGSLGTWVLDYVYDLPFLQLLNSNSLDIVIMQGLSGGIGVILTVPIAAGCSAFLLAHKRASVHETSPSQIG